MAEKISGDIFFKDNNTFGILDLEPILALVGFGLEGVKL